ncbi:MAG: InlB B-repeat-containing protein [Lachnospiraceae bacterium]|nr:InlB B-repeat-containing protein [Lachnospiraceae bacterium]
MKRKAVLSLLAVLTLTVGVAFGGCGATNGEVEGAVTESTAEAETNAHTVTLYDADGTTVLDTVEVPEGEALNVANPTKDGYTFEGWFVSADLNRRYDVTKNVTKDMDLYAGFSSYQEDERSFYIVGSGESELMAASNWGADFGDAYAMTKSEKTDVNEYTLTVDLQEGDQFQLVASSSWEDQRGFGYLDTDSLDGSFYFKSASGLGDASPKKTNIEVLKSGTYTFTLTTHPAEDYYDTEDEYYTEETKENFNLNPYDTISWTYEAN